jgi:D-alanyl-D-alanine carboxypeptidase/D-alanyl-D-alanine-endopeptidase (penicillin-binding protein 4)
MKGRGGLARAAALALLLGASAARAEDGLAARLDAALASRGLRGARIAALVVDREDGRVLYARDADRALVPASNMKILTALAALSAFGPTHRFHTEVLADAVPDASGAVDHLYLRAGGDPALTSEDLWRLAAEVRAAGVRSVRQGLVLDASCFDSQLWNPAWGEVSSRAYYAPISCLTVNYGAFGVRIAPGAAPGDPVAVSLEPPAAFLRPVVRAHTGPGRLHERLIVDRRRVPGAEEVVVSGDAPAGAEPIAMFRSVLDPVSYAGSVFEMQLAANGVEVSGGLAAGSVPEGAASLLVFQGKPLGEIVRLFVKYSNNAIAESLVKALGARGGEAGSWKGGLTALHAELTGLGIAVDRITQVDGSGLSYDNRVPPRVFVQALLTAHRSFRFGPEFEAALPIASGDGTLQERVGPAAYAVRAKTGLLTRVTGLSGFAHRADGHVVAFSVLTNGWRGGAEEAMAGVDAFAAALVAESTPRVAQERESP